MSGTLKCLVKWIDQRSDALSEDLGDVAHRLIIQRLMLIF
ncbi:hypothetical protein JOF57_003395 [Mycolicibacterium lutetiense]|uniref:Uncharacterized protein n=1 Tax=Mycolicibacterium lutetiense TaxID=1641992 RepID=A0ABS4ZVD6_9MYCO|nr:hypothetical protein [Mycolicibacterium lutetiense]